ncbi:hypothetical protein QQP08_003138 [Theobroma cacao]|nr:hypothetical protein QQP08_003138 [Theobroma cacao]
MYDMYVNQHVQGMESIGTPGMYCSFEATHLCTLHGSSDCILTSKWGKCCHLGQGVSGSHLAPTFDRIRLWTGPALSRRAWVVASPQNVRCSAVWNCPCCDGDCRGSTQRRRFLLRMRVLVQQLTSR